MKKGSSFSVAVINSDDQQALGKVPYTVDGQNCRAVKGQPPKINTVKFKRAGQSFDPQSQL